MNKITILFQVFLNQMLKRACLDGSQVQHDVFNNRSQIVKSSHSELVSESKLAKGLIAIIFLLIFPTFLNAQIRFEGTLDEAFDKAKSNNKMVFVYANTSWCEPCMDLEKYTFSDLEVSNFFNDSFINVAIDVEDYPGIDFGRKHAIDVYPALLFLNAQGDVIHRGCGSLEAGELLELGQIAIEGNESLKSYNDQYEKGERSAEFMINYLSLMELACMDVDGFVRDYFSGLSSERLKEEDNWIVFASYQWDIFSEEFEYVVNNKEAFELQFGKQEVNAKIYDTYLAQYQEVFESEELHVFGMKAMLNSIENGSFDGSDTLTNMMNLHLCEVTGDWESYGEYAIKLVAQTGIENPEELIELSWRFYLYIEDKAKLETALAWAKKAVDRSVGPSAIDTYASLLFKLGKVKQAIALEKKALEMAEQLYDDVTHYRFQLAKFEKGE